MGEEAKPRIRRVRGCVPELGGQRGGPRAPCEAMDHGPRDQRGADALTTESISHAQAPDIHPRRAETVRQVRQHHPTDAPCLLATDESLNAHWLEADPGFSHRLVLHLDG